MKTLTSIYLLAALFAPCMSTAQEDAPPPAAPPAVAQAPSVPPPPPPPPPPPAGEGKGLSDPAAVRIGQGIKAPTRLVNVNPVYPPDARDARVQGVVIMDVLLGVDGTVEQTKVLRSIPQLDQAAVDAVRQWVFTPTLLNGVPLKVIMTVTVNFTLQ